jgi:hypothetical protein
MNSIRVIRGEVVEHLQPDRVAVEYLQPDRVIEPSMEWVATRSLVRMGGAVFVPWRELTRSYLQSNVK